MNRAVEDINDVRPDPSVGIAYNLPKPGFLWSLASQVQITTVGFLVRGFINGLNSTEVHGLPAFYKLLQSRAEPSERKRGLLTVSNHICVMDDPLIWGALPLKYHFSMPPSNQRWGFGSHDICFTGPFRSHFFSLGQVLPAHRSLHSVHGGPYQTSMTEAIRILSPIHVRPAAPPTLQNPQEKMSANSTGSSSLSWTPWSHGSIYSRSSHPPSWPRDPVDPFSDLPVAPHFPSYPNDERNYLAPSRYACNSNGWVHIFPEGMIHQTETYDMRYFKWGVARLILEPPICPDIVPMWIQGTDQVMHESREFPRFLPRCYKDISITFGERVDTDARFGDLRARWAALKKEALDARPAIRLPNLLDLPSEHSEPVNTASPADLKPSSTELQIRNDSEDALTLGLPNLNINQEKVHALWEETALRVREEVLKLRRARGWPDEDPKASAASTWAREGPKVKGEMDDGSWVGEP